jgi:hypothetical protein
MHREPHFKAEMLAKFGRETGIDPSVAWPTKAQVNRKRLLVCATSFKSR